MLKFFLAAVASAAISVGAPAQEVFDSHGREGKMRPGAKHLPQISVATFPNHIHLAAGEEWSATTYRFTNSSPYDFEVVERSAFFHSLKNDWHSEVIGPIPTELKVPALTSVNWEDTPLVRAEMVEKVRLADGLADQELLFVQNFKLRSANGEVTHATATVVYRVEGALAKTERLSLPHYEVTVLSDLLKDPVKSEQLTKLLEFAEASYEKLASVVGFVPNKGRKVPLKVSSYGGFPHYQGGQGSFVNIPCDVVESQSTSQWLFVAFPHELTHYFLLEEFPNPPRWFVEGPASFFGIKVAEELGYREMAKEDREKIMGWAQDYVRKQHQYIFSADWPGDGGKPGEGYTLGLGRGYDLCVKLEELCGPEFFRNVFRYMIEAKVSFSNAKSERERVEILIGAMQTQTEHDLWAFFQNEGFTR